MSKNFELLWETHDFVLSQIPDLEEEYHKLLTLVRVDIESRNNRGLDSCLKKRFMFHVKKLGALYNKQICVIREIIEFYDEPDLEIPPEREVEKSTLQSLLNTTFSLKEILDLSTEGIENMLDI